MTEPALPPVQPVKPETVPQRPLSPTKPAPQPGSARKALSSS